MNAKISHDTITDLKPIGLIGSDFGNLLKKQNSPAPLQKTQEAFTAMIQSELPVWRKLMQAAKIEGA